MPPSFPARPRQVCVCLLSLSNEDPDGEIALSVWARDELDKPGELLGSLTGLQAKRISVLPKFYTFDLGSLDLTIDEPVYIGVEWDMQRDTEVYLCADTNGPGASGRSFLSDRALGPPNLQIGNFLAFPDLRALGIRVAFEHATACFSDSTTLCLNQGRFEVLGNWQTGDGQTGAATPQRLTDDTGYLWFFNQENVEVVVKVLDACAVNGHFWVFAGGLTDQGATLRIRDTQTGTVKSYDNPTGNPFELVRDVEAFPCS